MITALEGGEGSASRPGRSLHPGKTRYPMYRRMGGLQGRSGQVGKISPPPGFDPRTVQPVVSRYTGYATRPTTNAVVVIKKNRHPICCGDRRQKSPSTGYTECGRSQVHIQPPDGLSCLMSLMIFFSSHPTT